MLKKIVLLFLFITLFVENAFAFQNCQVKYDSDKRSLPGLRGMCNVCHISPNGGGPQNEFGAAYKIAGFKITDELVKKFPQFFQQVQETPSPIQSPGPPFIKRVKPKVFKVNVQSMLSIAGKNFLENSKVLIDNNEMLTTFKSSMLLLVDFVLDALGIHEVKIKNPDEQESNIAKIKAR